MPLKKGYSDASKAHNYKTLIAEGKSPAQAKAIMLNVARAAAKRAGKPGKGPAAPKRRKKG